MIGGSQRGERGNGRPSERAPGDGERVLVYFHGHGSDPTNVDRLLGGPSDDRWTRWCPVAPYVAGSGYSWFETGPRGVDWTSLGAAVDTARLEIDGVCGRLGSGSTTLVLGGFSQGGAFALALATVLGHRVGGLLLQSAFVPESLDGEVDLADIGARSILLQHGRHDGVVPCHTSEDLALMLDGSDRRVDLQLFDCGHEVHPRMVEAASLWLARAGGSAGTG